MRRALGLAALLVAAVAGGMLPLAAAHAQAQAGQPSPERQALGRQLAQLNNNEESVNAQVTAMLGSIDKMFREHPDMQALEKDYPGAIRMMLDAMGPVIREETIRTLPDLWDRLGALYAANLTEQQLRDARAFYSGPLGVRLRAAVAGNLDMKAVFQEAMANPDTDTPVSEKSLGASMGATALGTARSLSPEDQKALAQFAFTPAGSRLQALTSQVIKTVTDWSNAPSPELDAKLEKVTEAVVAKILDKERQK